MRFYCVHEFSKKRVVAKGRRESDNSKCSAACVFVGNVSVCWG